MSCSSCTPAAALQRLYAPASDGQSLEYRSSSPKGRSSTLAPSPAEHAEAAETMAGMTTMPSTHAALSAAI
eukprot:scaffold28337_cov45-Phaeocystis_antarctica.AAC.1